MAQELLRGPQGVVYLAILRQQNSFFGKPLVATLLSFRQEFFSFCVRFLFVFLGLCQVSLFSPLQAWRILSRLRASSCGFLKLQRRGGCRRLRRWTHVWRRRFRCCCFAMTRIFTRGEYFFIGRDTCPHPTFFSSRAVIFKSGCFVQKYWSGTVT